MNRSQRCVEVSEWRVDRAGVGPGNHADAEVVAPVRAVTEALRAGVAVRAL